MNPAQRLTCFISFSSESSEEADRLAELLQAMGVEIYRADLLPGREISREILTSLRTADFICLIVGGGSLSPNFAFEVGLAVGLSKPVLAFMTGAEFPFDLTGRVQILRVADGDFESAERDIARFVRHVRPGVGTAGRLPGPPPSLEWAGAELARIREDKDTARRETELINLVARVFENSGSEVLREGQEEDVRAQIDLLVWSDPLVADLGGPLIVECKYYGGGSGSVLLNARHAFRQLAGYVEQSNAKLGLLVFDHDRPSGLSLSELETPEALAFFIGDLVTAVAADELADEIRRRRARAARLRGIRGDSS